MRAWPRGQVWRCEVALYCCPLPVDVVVEMVVQQMVRVGGGLVRGRGQRVALRAGAPLQHGRGSLGGAEPDHQRAVRVRADAHARP